MWGKLLPLLLATTTTPVLRSPRELMQQYRETYRRLEVVIDENDGDDDGPCPINGYYYRVYPTPNPTLRFIHHQQKDVDINPPKKKPIAVYLPGLDGFGISAVAQLEDTGGGGAGEVETSEPVELLILAPNDPPEQGH